WGGTPPNAGASHLLRRLAAVLDVRPMRLAREVDQRRSDPANPITVKTAVHEDQVQSLYEHQSEFPGVQIQQTYLRHYRYQSLAAQILGYVGEISPGELKQKARENYRLGDKIGKTGVEATYDAYLRGRPGLAQIQVDTPGGPPGWGWSQPG